MQCLVYSENTDLLHELSSSENLLHLFAKGKRKGWRGKSHAGNQRLKKAGGIVADFLRANFNISKSQQQSVSWTRGQRRRRCEWAEHQPHRVNVHCDGARRAEVKIIHKTASVIIDLKLILQKYYLCTLCKYSLHKHNMTNIALCKFVIRWFVLHHC